MDELQAKYNNPLLGLAASKRPYLANRVYDHARIAETVQS